MKIQEITSQHRRDIHAIFECEHCGATVKKSGYDDTHFHQNVVPKMKCEACGEMAPDSHRPLAPRHDDGVSL